MLAGVAAGISACATVPDLGRKPEPRTASAYDVAGVADLGAWPVDRWWTVYRDPQLDTLIDEALAGSPSYAAAVARVRRADAVAEQAGAADLPAINADASIAVAKQSYNLGFPQQFAPRGYHSNTRVALGLSWDPDVWGRNRAALAAARGEALAARADAAEARRVLTASIASAYADLARAYADREAAQATLKLRGETQQLVALRLKNGLETRGSLRQNDAVERGANADLLALDETIAIARNRLAALAGGGPGRGLALTVPAVPALVSTGAPQRLALDLIGRRPDVVAARLRVEAADKRTDAARRDFYPNINITGFVGFQSLDLGDLLKAGSSIGSLGPALHLPIFDGGRLRGAYRANRADYDAAVANYDQALTLALQEVADAIAGQRSVAGRIAQTEAAVHAAEDVYSGALARYQAGLSPYLAVLQSQDAVIGNRRALADLKARAFSLDVQLIRALGGGYRADIDNLASNVADAPRN